MSVTEVLKPDRSPLLVFVSVSLYITLSPESPPCRNANLFPLVIGSLGIPQWCVLMFLCSGDKEGFLCAVKELGAWRESIKALQCSSYKPTSGIQRAGSGLLGCGEGWERESLLPWLCCARAGWTCAFSCPVLPTAPETSPLGAQMGTQIASPLFRPLRLGPFFGIW